MVLKQGKIKKKKFFGAKFTSTISIALVLFVLGLMFLSGLIASQISTLLKEQFTVTIVFNDHAEIKSCLALADRLRSKPYAKTVRYISREEAAQMLTAELGENPEDFLGYNPLYASIEMQLNADYACSDSLNCIKSQILTHDHKDVDSIDYNQALIEMVNANLKKVGLFLCGLAVILLLISISLINNTIRLSLHSERFLINTMRLVGATGWFIRRPFILSNMLCGFIASLLALGGLGGILYYSAMQDSLHNVVQWVVQPEILIILAGSVIGLGLLIPAIAAWLATDKYLQMKTDDLYLA